MELVTVAAPQEGSVFVGFEVLMWRLELTAHQWMKLVLLLVGRDWKNLLEQVMGYWLLAESGMVAVVVVVVGQIWLDVEHGELLVGQHEQPLAVALHAQSVVEPGPAVLEPVAPHVVVAGPEVLHGEPPELHVVEPLLVAGPHAAAPSTPQPGLAAVHIVRAAPGPLVLHVAA